MRERGRLQLEKGSKGDLVNEEREREGEQVEV